MESDAPLRGSSHIVGDTDVSSLQTPLVLAGGSGVAEVNPSAAVDQGGAIPMVTKGRGPKQFEAPPNTLPKSSAASESRDQPPVMGEGPIAPAAPTVNPEAPNTLEGALQSASIVEEHRTMMSAVMGKIQSVKGGLNEAFNSLLIG